MGMTWGDDRPARVSDPSRTVRRLAIDVSDALRSAPESAVVASLADLDALTLQRLRNRLLSRSPGHRAPDSTVGTDRSM